MSNKRIEYFKPSETVVSKSNVRQPSKVESIDALAKDIDRQGQLQPVLIKLEDGKPAVIAGQRRRKALIELEKSNPDIKLEAFVIDGDTEHSVSASLSENIHQQKMGNLEFYRAFRMLKDKGMSIDSIASAYFKTELEVRQILLIADVPTYITDLIVNGEISDSSLQLFALSPKSRVRQFIKQHKEGNCQLSDYCVKQFLLNGNKKIETSVALFDVENSGISIISDIFNDSEYFADTEAFWVEQNKAIEKEKDSLLNSDWPNVDVIHNSFYMCDYEKLSKGKGGEVVIHVESNGEVCIKKGLIEASKLKEQNKPNDSVEEKPVEKAEITQKMREYLLAYRLVAVRDQLLDNYDLTQRTLLLMLLLGKDGTEMSNCSQFDRVVESITNNELLQSTAYQTAQEYYDNAISATGYDINSYSYSQDAAKIFSTVWSAPIIDIQKAITALTVFGLTLNGDMSKQISVHKKMDMSDYWQASSHSEFFSVVSNKKLLLKIASTLFDDNQLALFEKDKVAVIREKIIAKVKKDKKYLPEYFTGGAYLNGKNNPFSE